MMNKKELDKVVKSIFQLHENEEETTQSGIAGEESLLDAPEEKDENYIEGGKADGMEDDEFDADALEKGIEVEKEHTEDEGIAKDIAKDHLAEFENYYDALADMEDELKEEQDGEVDEESLDDSEEEVVEESKKVNEITVGQDREVMDFISSADDEDINEIYSKYIGGDLTGSGNAVRKEIKDFLSTDDEAFMEVYKKYISSSEEAPAQVNKSALHKMVHRYESKVNEEFKTEVYKGRDNFKIEQVRQMGAGMFYKKKYEELSDSEKEAIETKIKQIVGIEESKKKVNEEQAGDVHSKDRQHFKTHCKKCNCKILSADVAHHDGLCGQCWEDGKKKENKEICKKCGRVIKNEQGQDGYCESCAKDESVDERDVDESKQPVLTEVKVVFNNKTFDIKLKEENESGVVISINKKQDFNFTPEFAGMFRDENGKMTDESLKELGQSALSNLSEEFFDELASNEKAPEPEAPAPATAPSESSSEEEVTESKVNEDDTAKEEKKSGHVFYYYVWEYNRFGRSTKKGKCLVSRLQYLVDKGMHDDTWPEEEVDDKLWDKLSTLSGWFDYDRKNVKRALLNLKTDRPYAFSAEESDLGIATTPEAAKTACLSLDTGDDEEDEDNMDESKKKDTDMNKNEKELYYYVQEYSSYGIRGTKKGTLFLSTLELLLKIGLVPEEWEEEYDDLSPRLLKQMKVMCDWFERDKKYVRRAVRDLSLNKPFSVLTEDYTIGIAKTPEEAKTACRLRQAKDIDESIIPDDKDSDETKIKKLTENLTYTLEDEDDNEWQVWMSEKDGKSSFSVTKSDLTIVSGDYSGGGITNYEIVEEETLVNGIVELITRHGVKKGYLDTPEKKEVEEKETDMDESKKKIDKKKDKKKLHRSQKKSKKNVKESAKSDKVFVPKKSYTRAEFEEGGYKIEYKDSGVVAVREEGIGGIGLRLAPTNEKDRFVVLGGLFEQKNVKEPEHNKDLFDSMVNHFAL